MHKQHPKSVTVRVPATTANLGPGFDCIGMALDLWNEVTVSYGEFQFEAEGTDVQDIPKDARNLIVTGVDASFKAADCPLPTLKYQCKNRIPVGKGLGSSSAAIVSGVLAGSALSGANLTPQQMVNIAADIEGHPDNVAPAIFGGCVIGLKDEDNGNWLVTSVPLPKEMMCVVYIPNTVSNTHESRARLPNSISRSDAVYNIGRAALLINSLSQGNFELLQHATQDKLHQPYRKSAFKAMESIMEAAVNGGAKGVFLSGSGPSIAALTNGREVTVSYEMAQAANIALVSGRSMILAPAIEGATVIEMQ